VLKSTLLPAAIESRWRPGEAHELRRCVRRSYRLDLMAAGQPCLLWVSGRENPGVHALGTVTGPPEDDAVPVRLTLLPEPVSRAELLADPRTAEAEVLSMPAGSNPSWLSAEQLTAVLDRVDPDRLGRWRA
jgi:hypothetical protein